MPEIGRTLIGLGVAIALIGLIITFAGKLGLHRLPGDFLLRRGGVTFFFPLASSIIISIVLTLLFSLLLRRKP